MGVTAQLLDVHNHVQTAQTDAHAKEQNCATAKLSHHQSVAVGAFAFGAFAVGGAFATIAG